ncbi:ATP-binding protein [Actinoplanes sp. NPDC049596]|uniref:ATP-binding protein n=1 Tax=unclassified Actinoplanes TaxID=2626549 RepID=UPI0034390849
MSDLMKLTGQALALTGPPGIGKSARLAQAEDDARGRGWHVHTVTGARAELGLPYAGIERLFRGVLPLDAILAERDPYRVALAVLDRLSPDTLLIADDAHWLDEPSWQVLAYVGRRLAGQPLTLLVSLRDGVETARRLAGSGLPEREIRPLATKDPSYRDVVAELPSPARRTDHRPAAAGLPLSAGGQPRLRRG